MEQAIQIDRLYVEALYQLARIYLRQRELEGSIRTLETLLKLSNECNLKEAIKKQFKGDEINETEGRAVLHTALRSFDKNSAFNQDIINDRNKIQKFSDDIIKEKHVSPAKVLQSLLEKKWSLKPEDKDMIVMQHQFEFLKEGENNKLYSSLIVSGEDSVNTAMAKTVGLPVAIATKLILNGEIDSIGVQIPTNKNIYVP